MRALLIALLYQHAVAPLLLPMLSTLAREDRWWSSDTDVVRESRTVWGMASADDAVRVRKQLGLPQTHDVYAASVLGVLNGLLSSIGVVLVANLTDDLLTPVPPYFELRWRWW